MSGSSQARRDPAAPGQGLSPAVAKGTAAAMGPGSLGEEPLGGILVVVVGGWWCLGLPSGPMMLRWGPSSGPGTAPRTGHRVGAGDKAGVGRSGLGEAVCSTQT